MTAVTTYTQMSMMPISDSGRSVMVGRPMRSDELIFAVGLWSDSRGPHYRIRYHSTLSLVGQPPLCLLN